MKPKTEMKLSIRRFKWFIKKKSHPKKLTKFFKSQNIYLENILYHKENSDKFQSISIFETIYILWPDSNKIRTRRQKDTSIFHALQMKKISINNMELKGSHK